MQAYYDCGSQLACAIRQVIQQEKRATTSDEMEATQALLFMTSMPPTAPGPPLNKASFLSPPHLQTKPELPGNTTTTIGLLACDLGVVLIACADKDITVRSPVLATCSTFWSHDRFHRWQLQIS